MLAPNDGDRDVIVEMACAGSGGGGRSLVSSYLTLTDINEGFDRLQEGHAVRQVVRLTP